MWTRAPSTTSCCLALDHEEDVGGANCPRDHHRGSSSNHHQPGEQELVLLLQDTQLTEPESAPLDFHTLLAESPTTTIHHDLPKPPGSSKRLPSSTTRGLGFISGTRNKLSPMSTPELASVVARVRQLQLPPDLAQTSANRVRKEKPQLDDMQTQIASSSSSDQEVPEVVSSGSLVALSKRRRLVYNVDESEVVRSPEGCEDSGLTAEQHMADLDRTSKSSTPEDIDSATVTTTAAAAQVSTSELAQPVPQCSTFPGNNQCVVEQENVVDQVLQLPEQLQILEHLHNFSSSQQSVNPGDDETQYSTVSQFLPPTGHSSRVPDLPDSPPTRNTTTKTMARSGGDEWLQLSLGGGRSQSDHEEPPMEEQPTSRVPLEIYQQSNPPSTPDPPGTRDFFKFGTAEMEEATSSHRHPSSTTSVTQRNPSASPYSGPHSGESSKQHYHSVEPSTTDRSTGILPRPLFLEPRGVVPPPPRGSSRDSSWLNSNAPTPRGLPDRVPDQFLVGLPVSQGGSFTPQQFSNLSSLPYHPTRVFQPMRSEPTETTAVHAWRAGGHDTAGPSSSRPHYASPSSAPWMQPEFPSMETTVPGAAFRDWRSGVPFLSMQPPLGPQGVDPEQAWRNLLQRVGNTVNMPSGAFGASTSSFSGAQMLRPGEREEYLDSLKRAVEQFQGADQGEAPTELQRLSRSAMFPPGQGQHHQQQQQRRPQYPGLGLQAFDPSTDITRFYTAPSSSGGKPRSSAPAGPGSSSTRILRPHAPRPGLWFTLQASSSSSQPERAEASPLRQIPTAYIRVVNDTMTVAAVRTYLANKLGLSEDEVELTCKGQPLQPGISLQQVRDGIWQSPNTNPPHPNTPQLLSEGRAWKAPDGSITLVGDVVMVLTYGRRPPQAQTPTST